MRKLKFLKLFDDYKTGSFKVKVDGNEMILYLEVKESSPIEVLLMMDDLIYDNLSVNIEDSKKLDKEEFFLNPEIHKNIINELEIEGFIEKSGKKSFAGDKDAYSYRLV